MTTLRFFPWLAGLIFCGAVCSATPVSAQKVHAVLCADLSPAARWGLFLPNLLEDMSRTKLLLEQGCPSSMLETTEIFMEENEKARPAALLNAVSGLRANRNDTILIYYTGHGGIDDRGSYFDMAGGKLYRETLLAAAKEHGSRLTVLVTDCCNARSDGFVQTFPRGGIFEREDYSPLFRSLLIDAKGVVDINACGPGESAFFTPLPKEMNDDHEYGSLFTKALARWVEDNNDRRATWDELLADVGVQVHLMFREAYPSGIALAKGAATQSNQNVFARDYPGMPKERGVRLGIAVRNDAEGTGATIVDVVEGSPATKAYDIENETYVPLSKGKRITNMNGRKIAGPTEFEDAIKSSPQIMRLTIEGADRSGREYLVRLSY